MDKVVVRQEGDKASVYIIRPITDDTSDSLKASLNTLIENSVIHISIDMEDINIVHTPILGVIVFAQRRVQKAGGSITTLNTSPPLKELFKTFGLDKVLIIK